MLEWLNRENIHTAAQIATVIGIIIAMFSLRTSINQFKKQLQLTLFSDYTKRYQQITLNFPENINDEDFDFGDLDGETKEKTLRYMRAYFDLCSEEYFLYSKKNIDDDTWQEWESGIKYALSKSSFRKGWAIIKLDTGYYPDFVKFVNPLVRI